MKVSVLKYLQSAKTGFHMKNGLQTIEVLKEFQKSYLWKG